MLNVGGLVNPIDGGLEGSGDKQGQARQGQKRG